jgi:peroxiredoxin
MSKSTLPVLLLLGLTMSLQAQDKAQTLPDVVVKTITGEPFNTGNIENNGNPVILSFWATWCKPCLVELDAINEVYADWQDETGVKLIAVSIDEGQRVSRIQPMVNGRAWEFEVLSDPNSDLKRAMGVSNVPHTFLLNGDKEVVWQHAAFAQGGEWTLYDEIIKLIETSKK